MAWKETEYGKKLRDPRWQKKRLEVLARDDWTCQHCFDSQSTLHVHHGYYESGKDPWEHPLDSLKTLCESCHSEETESLKDGEQMIVRVLKRAGANARAFGGMWSAFLPAMDKPLVNCDGPTNEWDMLEWHLSELIKSRARGGSLWASMVDAWEERERSYLQKNKAESGGE